MRKKSGKMSRKITTNSHTYIFTKRRCGGFSKNNQNNKECQENRISFKIVGSPKFLGHLSNAQSNTFFNEHPTKRQA